MLLDPVVVDKPGRVIIIHTLLSAGGKSTTSLLGNAVRILAENQPLQQQIRDDRTLVEPLIEEALRVNSIMVRRHATLPINCLTPNPRRGITYRRVAFLLNSQPARPRLS